MIPRFSGGGPLRRRRGALVTDDLEKAVTDEAHLERLVLTLRIASWQTLSMQSG
jgi:hypothetical protein